MTGPQEVGDHESPDEPRSTDDENAHAPTVAVRAESDSAYRIARGRIRTVLSDRCRETGTVRSLDGRPPPAYPLAAPRMPRDGGDPRPSTPRNGFAPRASAS